MFPITAPPLRDRPEDIPELVPLLMDECSKAMGKHIESVAKESIDALQRYAWPGNVRELRNMIERAVIKSGGPKLWIELPGAATSTPGLAIHEVERGHILRVLRLTGWRIRGRNGASEMLKLKPTTLENRMIKLDIKRPARTRA